MKTIAATTVLALAATTFAQNGATSAQKTDAADGATANTDAVAKATEAVAKATEAKKDLQYIVAGGYAHFFDTDFDTGGGGVAVNRGFGSLSVKGAPKDDYEWNFSMNWEGSWYSFQSGGTLVSAAGGKPWSAVQSLNLAPGATFKFGDHWRLTTALIIGFAGENSADAWDSATIGGVAAVSYAFSRDFVLGAGVLATTRLEDDALVIPQLIVDWKPCKEFRLSNVAGPEAYPGGAGLEAIWVMSDEFELGLGGRYTYRRFRLDDGGAPSRAGGVGTDQGLPLWLRATVRAKCGVRVDLIGGVQVASEMQLDDAAGNELASVDVEPNPFLGVFASWRF
jgi:hypothetical protein